MPSEKIACFTGHRPAKLWQACANDPVLLHELRHQLQLRILRAVEDGYQTFLCGMAQGVDLWAGEIVLSLQENFPELKLVAVLPYPGQGAGWGAEWKGLLQRVLRLSSEIIVVAPGYHRGCFLQRDRYLVDHATRLIGIWIEGSPGGTYYTIRYAEKKGLEIDTILLENEMGL